VSNENVPNWNQLLADETQLLRELASAAARTRAAALRTSDLTDLVEAQTSLCEQLEAFRARRDRVLRAKGYPPRDFLIAVLDDTPRSLHADVSGRFADFVAAAEAAQNEIRINREFFSVALASLEEVLDPDTTPTYGTEARQDREPVVVSYTA
jgi:hypothetical protein